MVKDLFINKVRIDDRFQKILDFLKNNGVKVSDIIRTALRQKAISIVNDMVTETGLEFDDIVKSLDIDTNLNKWNKKVAWHTKLC